MIRNIIFTSLSADPSTEPEAACAACLSIIVLDINGNDITQFRTAYKKWEPEAQKFATKYKFGPEFRAISKRLMRGDDLYGDDTDINELARAIRKSRRLIYSNTSIDKSVFNFIMMCARVLLKEDVNAWKWLEHNISILEDVRLNQVYLPDDDGPVEVAGVSSKDASKQMATVFEKLTGKKMTNGFFIAPTRMMELRDDKPDLAAKYGELTKILNKEIKKQTLRFVRASGKPLVSIDALSKQLEKLGLVHNLPRGFTGGQVDEDRKFYTAEGKQLDKDPLGLVRMNPKYDPETDDTYVLFVTDYGRLENGSEHGAGRIRTIAMNEKNKRKRHSAANTFLENERAVRAKWVADLGKKGTKEQIMAAMVELLYTTAARIGNKGNATKGEPTYGLTTLTADHVKVKNNKIFLDYKGKKNASQAAQYDLNTPTAKKVGDIITRLLNDKEKGELVFTWRGRPVLRHAVNAYMKSIGTGEMTAHGFRRVMGTKLASEVLAKAPFKKGDKLRESEVNRWVKKELEVVGKALNHRNGETVTGATSIKSYIDPDVLHNFYAKLGIRVPTFVPKLGSK